MGKGNETSVTIDLGVSGTVETVRELHQEIRNSLKESDAVMLQTASLERVDLSLIQLIYAARREALKKKKVLALADPVSPRLIEVLKDGGFIRKDMECSGSAEELEAALIDY